MSTPVRAHAPDELLAHAGFLRALARRLVADEATADDVEQETWRAALERPPRGAVRPWLAALARNAARKRHRGEARRRRREAAVAREEALGEAEASAARRTALTEVVQAVLALREPYRETVLLRYYEGLDTRAIARRMDVARDTVRSRLSRAHHELRRRLDSRFGARRSWALTLTPWSGAGSGAAAGSLLSTGIWIMKTRTLVGIVVGVALVGGLASWWAARPDPGNPVPPGAPATTDGVADGRSGNLAGAETGPGARVETQRAPADSPLVSDAVELAGSVVDSLGHPIPGATLFVGAERSPWRDAEPATGPDGLLGRSIESADDGSWSIELPAAAHVLVEAQFRDPYRNDPPRARLWVDAPRDDVVLVLERQPTATLWVRVRDERHGTDLASFTAVAQGEGVGYHQRPSPGERLAIVLPIDRGVDLDVRLIRPEPPLPVGTRVRLEPGDAREVTLVIPASGEVIRGQVVDTAGQPIDGALVYFGDEASGRGDEPFWPFRADWVSGVRTGAGGWFDLMGEGPAVSAWHAEYSPATVAVDAAQRIVLGPRATIRGQVLDETGAPAPGWRLTLDSEHRGEERFTDTEGRFEYAAVEAGAHAVWLQNEQMYGVRVDPGEVREVVLHTALRRLQLYFTQGGQPLEVLEIHGQVIGLDRLFSVTRLSHWRPATADPKELEVDGMPRLRRVPSGPIVTARDPVPPGRYLLVTAQGHCATFDVVDHEGQVELGSARLTVRARAGTNLQIVPAGSDRSTRVAAADHPRLVPAAGELAFGPIPAGAYELVGRSGRVLCTVDVPAEGVTVVLD